MKQPRVPEYRGEGVEAYIRTLILFLKDFCQEAWTENRMQAKAIGGVQEGVDGISYPVTSVNQKTGAVELDAADVGARAADWKPTASEIGALASGATAADAAKLGGKTWAQLLNLIYPVGCIYISGNATSPASLFGGTWERLQDRFLLAAGTSYSAGTQGGAAAVALATSQLPSPTVILLKNGTGAAVTLGNAGWVADSWAANAYKTTSIGNAATKNLLTYSGGDAHNNMPPYTAVYMWKRVS